MTRACALRALAATALTATLVTAGAAAAQRRAAAPTLLPSLPVIARIRVEAARDRLVLLEDVTLTRDEWRGGDLSLFVAFGAPGVPRAFDAYLFAVDQGALGPPEGAVGEPVTVERAPRKPSSAALLLGRAQMSGAVVHVREPAFRRATSLGGTATLRLRSLLDLPDEDARTGRELVVRLGVADGPPLAIARLEVAGLEPRPWITRAEAHLCGAAADAYPLAIGITLAPPPEAPRYPLPVAPWLAVRRGDDDLCLRLWTQP